MRKGTVLHTFILSTVILLLFGAVPVHANNVEMVVLDDGAGIISDHGGGSYTVTEYGDTYSLKYRENFVELDGVLYSLEVFNSAIGKQSENILNAKSILHYLEDYKSLSKTSYELSSNHEISLFYNTQPPTTGYRSFTGKGSYRVNFDGVYVTLTSASVTLIATYFGIPAETARTWIGAFLSGLGVKTALVNGYEKVWTATHTTCGAAARDRVQPSFKRHGHYYDAETPSGNPIFKYRNYWYTDPSGYPGC